MRRVPAKRAAPAMQVDARRFRVKVKFAIPPGGLGRVADDLHAFLDERLGRGRYAVHPDTWDGYTQASAVHLDDTDAVNEVIGWLTARVPAVKRGIRG